MPMADPTSRATSFTADATPCWATGSELMIAVVAGVDTSAEPAPVTRRPTKNSQYDESPSSRASTRQPAAMITMPNVMTARMPNRFTIGGVGGATAGALLDPWDQPYGYLYRTPPSGWSNPAYILWSAGPDERYSAALLAGGFPDEDDAANLDNLYASP